MKNISTLLKHSQFKEYRFCVSNSVWIRLYASVSGRTGSFWHPIKNFVFKTFWDEELEIAIELEMATRLV